MTDDLNSLQVAITAIDSIVRNVMGATPEKPPYFAVARSSKWPKVRKEWLDTHNRCAACGTVKALEVHHVKPYHLFPELELDPTNFITLCESDSHNCHFLFGHCLDWKTWNPQVRPMTEDMLKAIQDRQNSR